MAARAMCGWFNNRKELKTAYRINNFLISRNYTIEKDELPPGLCVGGPVTKMHQLA